MHSFLCDYIILHFNYKCKYYLDFFVNNLKYLCKKTKCYALRFSILVIRHSLFESSLELVKRRIGLVEKREHILLVRLNAGLVKGINAESVTGNSARKLEEV